MSSTIFIDAMGGDHAPACVLSGVKLAQKEVSSKLVLLGDESILSKQLGKFKDLEIIHCTENIAMKESPVTAVRSKKESSIVKGLALTAKTPQSAFFSAGHSGAVFAAALMAFGRLDGVERPAIATMLPTKNGSCVLLDAGANVDCRPQHLLEFAHMGSTYAQICYKKKHPTVGILSNGEEESKGTELTRTAYALLKEDKQINFIGYVEGKEIFNGKIDVVVTDGFTGNIVLKSLEGLAKTMITLFKEEFKKNWFAQIGAVLLLPALAPTLKKLQKKVDYAEVGSAPLLGVNGNCFIGHGRSSPKAIKNGILRAQEAIEMNLHGSLQAHFLKFTPQNLQKNTQG